MFYVIEQNEFCIDQLNANLKGDLNRIDLLRDIGKVPLNGRLDLLVVDGGPPPSEILHLIQKGTVCFIEGHRKFWREDLNKSLSELGLVCDFSNHHQGHRFFSFKEVFEPKTNKQKKKFKFFYRKKGCWIGVVKDIKEVSS